MPEEWTAAEFLEKLRVKFIVYTQKHSDSSNHLKDSIDLGICVVNYKESVIQFSGANRSLIMVSNKGYSIRNNIPTKDFSETESHILYSIAGTKNTIGYNDSEIPFKNHAIDFTPGDSFYVFSDGYGDQFDATNKKKFNIGRLKKELLKIQNLPMLTQSEYLDSIHKIWKDETEQTDDILIVGMKI